MDGSDPGTMARMERLIVDIEASSYPLPGSYPIEIALGTLDGDVRSWLIRPAPSWLAKGYWDETSQSVHGITRELLADEGQDAAGVAREVAARIDGTILLSDAPGADGFWLESLLGLLGPDAATAYEMADFWQALGTDMAARMDREEAARSVAAVMKTMEKAAIVHRAAEDVRRLQSGWSAAFRHPGTAPDSP